MPEITVKTFLPLASSQTDIRRFSFNTDETTLSNLQEKISGAYELPPASFKILWKDSDGDSITIATNDDFKAICRERQDVLKLYIQRIQTPSQSSPMEGIFGAASSSRQPQPEAPVDPDLHVGVTCDGCNNALRGIRFKCLKCPDYDLCAECEKKAIHPDHLLLKIPKPNMRGVMPIVLLSRALRDAKEMAAQGKTYCHTAMGAASNVMHHPEDYMDLNAMGQQLTTVLNSLGIDANYFVQQAQGRAPSTSHSSPTSSGCPFNPSSPSPDPAAAAAIERRVTETLEHLRAMGFQDENGSLTNLVRSKKGDLFAVLDILKTQQ